MKNTIKVLAFAMVLVLMATALVACGGAKLSTEEYTGEVIYVGNTAAITGAYATIGVPFNYGIQAAFAAYNAKGGFNGKTVALKHYDDAGDGAQSAILMEKLIHEDNIFAVVGNYGSYAVSSNLQILKDAAVPMVYAAAGNNELFNDKAEKDGDRAIFPVQPLNQTEGQVLALRAFAPADKGGLAGTKVGVIGNSEEASVAMVNGIKAEADQSGLTGINYQTVTTDDYSAAAAALQAAGCDVVIVTVVGTPFITALTALANVNYTGKVLTSYNNSSAAVFNDATTTIMTEAAQAIFAKMTIYAQGWLDINSATYVYKDEASVLWQTYNALGLTAAGYVPGFTEEYWTVANNIFNYVATVDATQAFTMSFNSYALAGYIAGDMFCQVLAKMQASQTTLTRANFVQTLETGEFHVAMADSISFQNGLRAGVDAFSLTQFYDSFAYGTTTYHSAASATMYSLTSIAEYRQLLAK
ncbi:MAG: ABC transporter substrate-binding protein [Clostridia bacterium]|nr:ABC transporter substrate-binding protein [Clostridia bacterium]